VEIRVEGDGAVVFAVRVQPRAGRDAIRGVHGDALKIALGAAPVDGAANEALIALVAKALGVGRRDVEIVSGETNRNKRLRVHGTSAEAVRALADQRGAGGAGGGGGE
jgi:uncharacterized protein (TIGR00251 family)